MSFIKFQNVSFSYENNVILDNISFEINQGESICLVGSNGAGKSTFLKILSGELEPTTGEISLGPGERLSVLEQDHFKYDDQIVLDTVIAGNQKLYDIMKEKDAIYAKEIGRAHVELQSRVDLVCRLLLVNMF